MAQNVLKERIYYECKSNGCLLKNAITRCKEFPQYDDNQVELSAIAAKIERMSGVKSLFIKEHYNRSQEQ